MPLDKRPDCQQCFLLRVMREAIAGWECSDPESCDERRIICPRCRIRNYLYSLPAPPEGGAGH